MHYVVKGSKVNDPRILAMVRANGDDPDTNLVTDTVRVDSWKAVQKRAPGNPWKHMSELYGNHPGKTALVTGSGSSLSKLRDLALPSEWIVLAVNRSWRLCQKVDYWCATDPSTLAENADAPESMTRLFSIQLYDWMRGKPCYMAEFAGEPLRWNDPATRPLYYNETTSGWAIHAAIRMGCDRIILLGHDLPGGGQWDGYVQPGRDKTWQVAQHIGVADRMTEMFRDDIPQWYERPVTIIDASTDPYLPVKRAPLEGLVYAG